MSPEMSNNQKNKIGCCRVKVVVGIFCILDIIFFGISIILKLENPLMSCKAAYIDALSSSPDASKGSEKAHIISTQVDAHFHSDGPPAKLEYICTTNFLVAAFAFLHICVDCVTLFAIFKGRHRLIIPFLAIIVFGIIMQLIFFGIVLAGATFGEMKYDVIVLVFVAATFMLNIYLFLCAKRLFNQFRDASFNKNVLKIKSVDLKSAHETFSLCDEV